MPGSCAARAAHPGCVPEVVGPAEGTQRRRPDGRAAGQYQQHCHDWDRYPAEIQSVHVVHANETGLAHLAVAKRDVKMPTPGAPHTI